MKGRDTASRPASLPRATRTTTKAWRPLVNQTLQKSPCNYRRFPWKRDVCRCSLQPLTIRQILKLTFSSMYARLFFFFLLIFFFFSPPPICFPDMLFTQVKLEIQLFKQIKRGERQSGEVIAYVTASGNFYFAYRLPLP